jgi:tRNA nucleotidyltransferase/poly(A) polymerase
MDFIQDIEKNHGEVYLVGGMVRDRYYNKFYNTDIKSKDFDILICKISSAKLEIILKKYGYIKEVGKAFGIITFHPNNKRINQYEFDIALPRYEKSTGPGYKDFHIVSDENVPIEKDLERRDTTINAMAYRLYKIDDMLNTDINEEQIIDKFNGKDDIKKKLIKAVGDPNKRLLEDPTRIMRALRQSAKLGFTIDDTLQKALIDNSQLLNIVKKTSSVRISEELTRLLLYKNNLESITFILKHLQKELELNIPEDKIKTVICSLKYANEHNMGIQIKYAILLQFTKPFKWARRFDLSASNHFPTKLVKFLDSSNKSISMLTDLVDELDKTDNIRICIRKIIQSIDNKKMFDVINYYLLFEAIILKPNGTIKQMFTEEQNIIRSTSDIALDGNTISIMYDVKGREIGKIKIWLFEQVTDMKVENVRNKLIEHMKLF